MDKWILENRITAAAIAVACAIGLLIHLNSGPESYEECIVQTTQDGAHSAAAHRFCRKEFPSTSKASNNPFDALDAELAPTSNNP